MYEYKYEYDRKGYYDDKHDKHDKYTRLKCYWGESDNDHKYDDKKDYDDYKDEKKKFILKGYLYFREDHDCDCKERYY
ncbi:hypothetical protein [Priestia endophytica]|uniref:hypothetical protein n=1 Tax=Priestia endophytica TaxID=135735 RepID=UPI00124EA0FA|nr:hypothetical protein [Priestia endophytica]KAB2488066.1 hypothetical protein F8155_25660 [Priestia endophytica]